ncbi:MAG: hypothetical protein E7137_07075 [Rikenellaceae bacterium]|nr:hypothetical protein [Rikenellaceae bacterium]
MKKILSLIVALACCCLVATAGNRKQEKANADTDMFRYDLEYVKSGGSGVVNVKVWSYSKKKEVANEQNRKNAVHGILFKGHSGSGAVFNPIVKSATALSEHAEFFAAFFADGGDYQRYVEGSISGSTEVVKVGKEYKVGAVVRVRTNELRKHLEQANIIRGLSSGF